MKKKISNPKVFISYAWASKDYEERVLAFASQLVGDGIDVVIDKWDMSEGNDTYSFMERCVTDPSITNVLMLIDPVYARKADAHSGGVGTETQIISAKVYQEVNQDKFIPIVFERNEEGNICKPTYLQGRLHFDLTNEDGYDDTYKRLVKTLFGEEVYVKPKLGSKPTWVEQPSILSAKTIISYDVFKKQINDKVKLEFFRRFLKEFADKTIAFSKAQHQSFNNQEIIDIYDETHAIRVDYLALLSYLPYIDKGHISIASIFEELSDALYDAQTIHGKLAKTFLHEMFIYSIAYLWNIKNYAAVAYILNKTYFSRIYSRNDSGARNFDIFYSRDNHEYLDNAISSVDNQKYYSGTAHHWIQTIQVEYCTREQFVFADLLCFNCAVYGKNYFSDWAWFPLTYCYENEYNSSIARMAKKLISKEYVDTILSIFGYQKPSELAIKIKEVQESGNYRNYRHRGAFDPAPILGYFVDTSIIATLP